MSALNTFPSRIRFVNPNGTLTPEAARMLDVLIVRGGGAIGEHGDDVFALTQPVEYSAASGGDVIGSASESLHFATIGLQPPPVEATLQGYSSEAMIDIIIQPASVTGPIRPITPAASPTSFTAIDPGTLSVQGGTVSLVTLARASASITLGLTAGLVPLSAGDKVTITYTAAPTLNFIPR